MKLPLRTLVAALLAACGCGPDVPAPVGELAPAALGTAPICEASALVHSPWDPDGLLVADDEEPARLYRFRQVEGRLIMPLSIPLPADPPRDVEALAVDGTRLFVVGSHALRRDCSHDPERERVLAVGMGASSLTVDMRLSITDAAWRSDVTRCITDRFAAPAPADAEALCTQIVTGEMACVAGAGGDAFAIEGAIVIAGRLWLGLRAPLLDGDAILVRMQETEHRFDAIARLRATGGVRDMASDGASVFAIAGEGDTLSLVRFPASSLVDGVAITTTTLRALRGSSEGLALDGDAAFVVTDGVRGSDPARCEEASLQQRVLLETP